MASLWDQLSGFLFGKPQKVINVPTMGKQQRALYQQLMDVLSGQESSGAFGDVASYYRDLLDPSSQAYERFAAPELRRFQEELVPDLAERFANMGSGGALSGSGFRNALTREASSLSERLAAMRAGLQQQGAAGLSGLASTGLGMSTFQPVLSRGSEGLFGKLGTGIAGGIGQGLAAGSGDLGRRLSAYIYGGQGNQGGQI